MKSIATWMALAIVLVALLAYWDERRESAAALADVAAEQVTVATAIAVAVSDHPETALELAKKVERPHEIVVFLRRPGDVALRDTSGAAVAPPSIDEALARDETTARLSREDAAALGLPARTALAGIALREGWSVAVVATAERERDRELRAMWRLLLGVFVAAGLVVTFGGLALRKQRRQLELARELAVAAIERERDETLIRADKLGTLGAMATGIAHEVATPLAVIVGRAEQLAPKVAGDERAERAVKDIVQHVDRIERVMRGFLTLARGESPAVERVDPKQLAERAADLVAHRFAKAGVHLDTAIAEPLPKVACEPRLFEQAIVNLLLNACDACEAGGRVELAVRPEGDRVLFVVDDDGAGISPEVARRATDPFFTTKPAGKGTGLGLAIANEIAKHHNGALAIGAREGERGTRASLAIPRVRQEGDDARI